MEKPTLPKGTRDFGPSVMARRQYIFTAIRSVFQKFGFQPLETPAMENLSTLTGKYGEEGDQLLFRILNSGDFLKDVDPAALQAANSKSIAPSITKKGLRYDLTVPFARFVVMNRNEITFPFKRYQIQPVWRADRPQKGRYQEFYQCDADVVGTRSLLCEAEIIMMIGEVFGRLNVTDYSIKINHRGILSGLAEITGSRANEGSLFIAIDKLEKIGEQKVREELAGKGFSNESLDSLFEILNTRGTNAEKLQLLESKFANSSAGTQGIKDIRSAFEIARAAGDSLEHVEFDLSLARGLSYYTGCIFEVKISGVAVGSVSGGGRYDNLTGAFGDKDNLPGVGFSFGVDRIYDAMDELNLFPQETTAASGLLICHFDEETFNHGLGILSSLRTSGISSELYPDQAKLKKQLDYANRKGIPFCVVIGSDEVKSGSYTLKNMQTGEQQNLTLEQMKNALQ